MTLFFLLQRPESGGGRRRKKRSFQAQNFCPFQIGGPLLGGRGARQAEAAAIKKVGGEEGKWRQCSQIAAFRPLLPLLCPSRKRRFDEGDFCIHLPKPSVLFLSSDCPKGCLVNESYAAHSLFRESREECVRRGGVGAHMGNGGV